ncbi:MAG: hypothetical protein MZV70_01710 [Desulfobacterales bacterium]|nr:hypothetical protein [Desulfobacterales bacterium]
MIYGKQFRHESLNCSAIAAFPAAIEFIALPCGALYIHPFMVISRRLAVANICLVHK